MPLHHQRCFNHADREAVARCPQCGHSYCRECVTEHDDRLMCAACLTKLTRKVEHKRRRYTPLLRLAQMSLGIVLTWLFFHWSASLLMSIPSEFHEGSVWKIPWYDQP
jgi:uncharacterized paraquat-inducible protein A